MRSLDQIKIDLVNGVLALRSDIRLVEGDTEYDVMVAATAPLFYRYEVLLELEDRTRNLQEFTSLIGDADFKATLLASLGNKPDGTPYTSDDVDALISARLDAYVQDFNIVRSVGTAATGTVTMYLVDASPISWNSNTTFTTAAGQTYTATNSASTVIPNFSTSKGLYYVVIPVQATAVGQAGNATAGSIKTVSPKPTNFSYCTNEAGLNGGSDEEDDLELIARAQTAWADRVNGSVGGLQSLAQKQSYVDDVLALNEDDATTGVYLGSPCDLFTQFTADNQEMVEEYVYWPGQDANNGVEQFSFTPTHQPVISTISPVFYKYTQPGNVETQIDPTATDTSITIVKDTGTYSGSVKGMDKFVISMPLYVDPAKLTGYQRKLRVFYVYDKNPYKLQAVLDDPTTRMIGPQALVRKADAVPLRVIVELTTSFGYVAADVQTAVTANIGIFFNGGTTSYGKQFARKGLGERIQHSDIAQVILQTAGVVAYDTDTFHVINSITGDFQDPTTMAENQYPTLLDVLYEYNTFNLSNFNASF